MCYASQKIQIPSDPQIRGAPHNDLDTRFKSTHEKFTLSAQEYEEVP
jgi:hypothetical protein